MRVCIRANVSESMYVTEYDCVWCVCSERIEMCMDSLIVHQFSRLKNHIQLKKNSAIRSVEIWDTVLRPIVDSES